MKTPLIALLVAVATFGAQAQTHTPRADKREAHQQARISQGAASGSLTAQETQRLEKEQAHINKMEDKAKADGKVTAGERARIENAQDKASHDIARKKHNKRNQ